MDLLGVVVEVEARSLEVLIECGSVVSAGALRRSLEAARVVTSDHGPLMIERTGQFVMRDSFEVVDLRWADRLVVADRGGSGLESPRRPVEVVAVSGPQVGDRWALLDGANPVHRGPGAVIDLGDDPAVSRDRHAVINLSGAGVRVGPDVLTIGVDDLESRHGTSVDGAWIDQPTAATTGSMIVVGDTDLMLARMDPEPTAPHLAVIPGALAFHRPPRVLSLSGVATIELPAPPQTPPSRRFPLGGAVVPVLLGAVVFAVTRSPLTLLFMALGPAMAIWSFVEDRTSGRSDFGHQSTAWLARVEVTRGEADARSAESVAHWRSGARSPAELIADIAQRSSALWQRRPEDADYSVVRIGLARQRSRIQISLADGGDDQLRRVGNELVAGHRDVDDVPVEVDLGAVGILGISGPAETTGDLARSIVVQLAAQHSPGDLSIVVLGAAGGWDWAKWLPHARMRSLDGMEIASSREAAAATLASLAEEIARSSEEVFAIGHRAGAPVSVSTIVVVDGAVDARPAEITGVLDGARRAGIVVVWLEREAERLPHGCRAVVTCRSSHHAAVVHTFTGERTDGVAVDHCPIALASSIGRWMAPLVDAHHDGVDQFRSGTVDLVSALGLDLGDPEALAARWTNSRSDARFVIGVGSQGVITIDLLRDGPHVLVAGTTGAGKSAMLRAWLVSLAADAGPDRLNIVLIDYKASAGFQRLDGLPHVVATITNLDRAETDRGLISLEAELRRRQQLLSDHGAEDLEEFHRIRPEVPLARLVLVVDEFRALKEQVPAFVDGLVDLAGRGRNVGIHLILATQRPEGVISPDIQANTNLRVALRVASTQESREVIGDSAAALISPDHPGRGLVTRAGGLVPFRSLFVDGWSGTRDLTSVTVRPFGSPRPTVETRDTPGPTDLDRFVGLATAASSGAGIDAPRRPWFGSLPTIVGRSDLMRDAELPDDDLGPDLRRTSILLGLLDEPHLQAQGPWWFDPGEAGAMVVFGDAGSGRSSFIRQLLIGMAERSTPEELVMYCIDANGQGLSTLAALPHCGGVIPISDVERLRRLTQMLNRLIEARSTGPSIPGAERLAGATVVVVIDGFGSVWATHSDLDEGRFFSLVHRLASDGPSLGIRLVITADRSGSLTPTVAAAMRTRLVMRLTSPEESAVLGFRDHLPGSLPPGRVLLGAGTSAQVLWEDDIDEQARLSRIMASHPTRGAPAVRLLPERVVPSDLPVETAVQGAGRLVIGIDEDHAAAVVDLGRHEAWLVLGPARSGRTTALHAAVSALENSASERERFLICGRRSSLTGREGWTGIAAGESAVLEMIPRWSDGIVNAGRSTVVVVDDLDELVGGIAAAAFDRLWKAGRDAEVRWLVSMATYRAATSFEPVVRALLAGRHGLILQPDPNSDGDLLGARLPRFAGRSMPAGRGLLIADGSSLFIQVADLALPSVSLEGGPE